MIRPYYWGKNTTPPPPPQREGEGGRGRGREREGGEVQERGKCNLRSPMIAANVGCGGE